MDDFGKRCSREKHAVLVRRAFKHFGSKSRPNPVLVNLNMTVAKGTIYGLLGASGCGKTTLLSCLVGRKKFNSGDIWVLGGRPTTKDSGVPGKRIGYMPQELALYGEFTIKETMMYFGWIFGMKTDDIVGRLRFLLEFLDLPPEDRIVKSLSGGQQRRVSFAVALMHDPELLILDEPTVGVDPLLRRSIWNHLVEITKTGERTIIITTHYIEEARQAHTIGLMRSGRLLSEESPQSLLAMHQCSNLEDVFLKLSRKQGTSSESFELTASDVSLVGPTFGNMLDTAVCISQDKGVVGINFYRNEELDSVKECDVDNDSSTGTLTEHSPDNKSCWNHITSKGKARALLQKHFLQMWRSVGLMFFVFALPAVQMAFFCLSIGRDAEGLKLAIVNMEVNGTECSFEPGCHFSRLSCRFLSHLNESILREYHSDLQSAIETVKTGQAWGAVYFGANFTNGLVTRQILGRSADDETLNQSDIRIWLDMSNMQIASQLTGKLQSAYRSFARGMLKDCNFNPKLGDLPIQFEEPIYGGDNSASFTDFVAPGVVITIIFFLSVAMTAIALIVERTEGLFDRSWVAGVTSGEILFSHVVNQFLVMSGQTALILIFMLCVFNITCIGNMVLVITLTLLAGLCGMCFGFVISVVCDVPQNAMPLALGSFYPSLLLGGVIWPLEGMPSTLRYIAHCMPLTQAVTALRAVFARGWGIDKPEVYLGFVATVSWIALFLVIALVTLKIRPL